MASGTKSKSANKAKNKAGGGRAGRRSTVATAKRPKPWGTILAVIAVIALGAGVFTYAFMQIADKEQWVVSEDNQDPSTNIDGVSQQTYDRNSGQHVKPEQRVAYDQNPPFGGPHDQVWAACTGVVYDKPVRNENMVHSLEHGAVWIAYNPDKVKGGALDKLKGTVEGQPYLMLSPYPGLDKPISLQSWGHQLKVSKPDDPRVEQFIDSLRQNPYQHPEDGGSCDAQPGAFDPTNPPPFVAEKPGKDAVTMDGKGAIDESQTEGGGTAPPGTQPPGTQPPGTQPPGTQPPGTPPPGTQPPTGQ